MQIHHTPPIKKTRTIEVPYWSCGIDDKWHFHKTKKEAQSCIERRAKSVVIPDYSDLQPIVYDFFCTLPKPVNYGVIAKKFGINARLAAKLVNDEEYKNKLSNLSKILCQNNITLNSLQEFKALSTERLEILEPSFGNLYLDFPTIGDVLAASDNQLLKVPFFGKITLEKIRDILSRISNLL